MKAPTNKPATPETYSALYEKMGVHIEFFNSILQKTILKIKDLQQRQNKTKEENFVLALYEIYAFAATVNLDIATFLRADFRSNLPSEKRINIRYINVAVIEGYKYLGATKNEDQNNAKWEQFKVIANELSDSELNKDIAIFDNSLAEFKTQYFNKVNINNRNLAIHYDKDPFKVYDYYISLDEDIEVKRVCEFFKLIDKLVRFLTKHISKIELKPDETPIPADYSLIERINTFFTDNHDIFHIAGKAIETYSESLDKMSLYRKLPDHFATSINEKFNIGKNEIKEEFKPVIDDMKPGILVMLIYLDLCAAVRAYLSSESYCEKQLNLRHIEVIVYEGCKHLYGFNDTQQKKSFWQTTLSPLFANSNNEAIKKCLFEIQESLSAIISDKTINNEALRECFVHYRYENRDNTVTLFEESQKSFAIFEFNKAKLLLDLLPKIIKINGEIMLQKNQTIKEQNQKKKEEIIALLRKPLDKITDTKKREEFEKTLQPIIALITKIYS